jgi:transmembrane sensor
VLLGIAGLGISKWRGGGSQTDDMLVDHLKDPAGIATSKATLTLADGSVIVLDDNHKQFSGALSIIQQEGHRLIYMPAVNSGGMDAKEAYNILTVPRGMQFELVLADGTKVWLNDESSLRYPVGFAGRERDLELKGEAYFEVTKSEKLPFRVRTSSLMTVVLGTHFNVRDYPAEHRPRTTLLEGKVVVRKGNETATLDIAGQEAQVREGVPGLEVVPVNPETRMAWKNGYFYFDHHDIRTSLEEVARWYKKKLVFKDNTETAQLGEGQVTRNQSLRQLLENIERPDLHFHYGDSTIIVSH